MGDRRALKIYQRLAEHAVAEALALYPRAAVRVHFTPPGQVENIIRWLGPGPVYLPQSSGNLGERLARAFDEAFGAGFGRVLVIGSDLPHLTRGHLERAISLLDRSEAVVGPARDGGYWLLGLRRPRPELFADVDWSTDRVLRQTLARMRAGGIDPAFLEELSDVDEEEDLPEGWEQRQTPHR